MDNSYLSLLPTPVKTMVAEVEAIIGSAIRVRPKTSADLAIIPDPSIVTSHVNFNGGVFTASIASNRQPQVRSLVHELMHIHLQTVNAAPRLISDQSRQMPDKIKKAAVIFQNDLEHYFIIPQEVVFCLDSQAYWESIYDAELLRIAPYMTANPSTYNLAALRETLLRAWLLASTAIPQWKNISRLQAMLQQKGWLSDAEGFVDEISRENVINVNCLTTTLRYTGYNINDFWQNYFDIPAGRPVSGPLPPP